jgi:hypothetical protein
MPMTAKGRCSGGMICRRQKGQIEFPFSPPHHHHTTHKNTIHPHNNALHLTVHHSTAHHLSLPSSPSIPECYQRPHLQHAICNRDEAVASEAAAAPDRSDRSTTDRPLTTSRRISNSYQTQESRPAASGAATPVRRWTARCRSAGRSEVRSGR